MLQKKTMFTGIAIVCMSLGLFGCGKEDELELPPPQVKEVIEEEPEEETAESGDGLLTYDTAYPVIGERQSVNGQIQSYLTGQWTDETR